MAVFRELMGEKWLRYIGDAQQSVQVLDCRLFGCKLLPESIQTFLSTWLPGTYCSVILIGIQAYLLLRNTFEYVSECWPYGLGLNVLILVDIRWYAVNDHQSKIVANARYGGRSIIERTAKNNRIWWHCPVTLMKWAHPQSLGILTFS